MPAKVSHSFCACNSCEVAQAVELVSPAKQAELRRLIIRYADAARLQRLPRSTNTPDPER